jgi:phosphoserine phosphatase/pimeloyl-ACP methyl ester carboxylesterase
MKLVVQTTFAEIEDPGLDQPLCIHQRTAPTHNHALVIFVHGLGGSRYGTWGSFPRFVYEDNSNLDVGMYSYRTFFQRLRLTRSIELRDEAGVFADIVRDLTTQTPPYKIIVLIGHSMGGLLCKALIWRLLTSHQENLLASIRGLILMATPQLGSLALPRFLWDLTADARALRPHGDLIAEITKTFDNYLSPRIDQPLPDRATIPTFVVVAASDQWVDRLSAGLAIPAAQSKTVIGSHTSIVKPRSKESDAYQFVLAKINDCYRWQPAPAAAVVIPTAPPRSKSDRYRVIAFDLDGTLIRGIEFSWTLVWDYLKFPEQVRKTGMLRYRRHETTYQVWCEWACNNFRSAGLRRQQFPDIVKGLRVTKNLHKAIGILKADGFVTAIISGGIDVFLEELIPDAGQLFDHIFINKLKFDQQGLISGVEATPYDFEGKLKALELVCAQHGYQLADAVFVGEGFNDEFVADKAGLTIAYPPTAQGFSTASAIEIKEDDLMKVVERVLISN